MKFLLDTHILIWVVENNSSLSKKHSDIDNEKFVSEVSFIELAIKLNIGKMPDFKLTLGKFISQVKLDGFNVIPISKKHLEEFVRLPLMKEHHDPFDRLLISTAISQEMSIISIDEKFKFYKKMVNII